MLFGNHGKKQTFPRTWQLSPGMIRCLLRHGENPNDGGPHDSVWIKFLREGHSLRDTLSQDSNEEVPFEIIKILVIQGGAHFNPPNTGEITSQIDISSNLLIASPSYNLPASGHPQDLNNDASYCSNPLDAHCYDWVYPSAPTFSDRVYRFESSWSRKESAPSADAYGLLIALVPKSVMDFLLANVPKERVAS
jgi:hypothetical protein